jgi:hypothetical protein
VGEGKANATRKLKRKKMTETSRLPGRVVNKWFLALAAINKAVLLVISGPDGTEHAGNHCGLYLERSSIPGAFQAYLLCCIIWSMEHDFRIFDVKESTRK